MLQNRTGDTHTERKSIMKVKKNFEVMQILIKLLQLQFGSGRCVVSNIVE